MSMKYLRQLMNDVLLTDVSLMNKQKGRGIIRNPFIFHGRRYWD